MSPASSFPPSATAADLDIVLVGRPFSGCQQGEDLRLGLRALRSAGVSVGVRELRRTGIEIPPDAAVDVSDYLRAGPGRDANIFVLGPADLEELPSERADLFRPGAINVLQTDWDLAAYPDFLARRFRPFDEIWTPSRFVQRAISAVTDKPVLVVQPSTDPRVARFLGRRHFGIPDHAHVCIALAGGLSETFLGDPLDAIAALELACLRAPGSRLHLLILFTTKPDRARLDQLRARAGSAGDRVQFLQAGSLDDTINLVRNSDCVLSLHRSVGTARMAALGMALGRPVVATGYSGMLENMTPSLCRLVDFEMTLIPDNAHPFGRGQSWAIPSIEGAADAIVDICSDPEAAARTGARARRHMGIENSPRAAGLRYLARIAAARASPPQSAASRAVMRRGPATAWSTHASPEKR